MKCPPRAPDPNWMIAFCSVFYAVLEAESSYENSFSLSPANFVFLLRIHVFVDPVSKSPLIFYGGLPMYMSEI